jgi:hypothetical protein
VVSRHPKGDQNGRPTSQGDKKRQLKPACADINEAITQGQDFKPGTPQNQKAPLLTSGAFQTGLSLV